MRTLLEIKPREERDAVAVRQAARHAANLLGFEHPDQIRIATAASELVRAALGDDGGDVRVAFLVSKQSPQRFVLRVTSAKLASDAGERSLPQAADGKWAAQRLLDRFEAAEDTRDTIALARLLPLDAPRIDPKRARDIAAALERHDAFVTESYLAELKQQNRELSSTLVELERKQHELERKQEELARLNAELGDTNRGVMALYAELDERASDLRRAVEIKSKFLSNMSHEFRTPLNSIRTLSQLLLDQTDGPLNGEQLRQAHLIHGASTEMLDLVGDLLDLAKVEAGKTTLEVGEFTVGSVFGALRGMIRPLLRNSNVVLTFDEEASVPAIVGDEGKVAQILRNFLSNALKFTERGSITVNAVHIGCGDVIPGSGGNADQESIVFCVTDTGLGISAEDQEYIFEEFTQVHHALQRRVRGTGLGLPLCRNLATLLGGRVWVESELGAGSSFRLLIPRFFRPSGAFVGADRAAHTVARTVPPALPLLIVSETHRRRRKIQAYFESGALSPVGLGGAGISAEYLTALRPPAAVVDVSPQHPVTRAALDAIRSANIAVVLVSEAARDDDRAAPLDSALVSAIHREIVRTASPRLLFVDDDERFRTVLLKYVQPVCPASAASADPHTALDPANRADALVLDLIMPDIDGLTVLTLLRERPATVRLPVLACSSKTLSPSEHRRLTELRAAFLSKSELTPESLFRGLVDAHAWISEGAVSDTGHNRGEVQ